MIDSQEHYGGEPPKFRRDVQPIELILSMGLGFMEGNVIKYVARAAKKGGLEDLRKARTYLDWIIKEREADENRL